MDLNLRTQVHVIWKGLPGLSSKRQGLGTSARSLRVQAFVLQPRQRSLCHPGTAEDTVNLHRMKSILPLKLSRNPDYPPELQYQEWNPLQLLKPDKSPPWLVFTVVLAVGPTCQPASPTCHPLLSLSFSPSLLSLSLSPPRACPHCHRARAAGAIRRLHAAAGRFH